MDENVELALKAKKKTKKKLQFLKRICITLHYASELFIEEVNYTADHVCWMSEYLNYLIFAWVCLFFVCHRFALQTNTQSFMAYYYFVIFLIQTKDN